MGQVALADAGAEPDLAQVGHGHDGGIHIVPVAALRARHLHHAAADGRLDHVAAARAFLHGRTQLGQMIGGGARIGTCCGQRSLRGLVVLARGDLGIEQQLLAVEFLARVQQRGLGLGVLGTHAGDPEESMVISASPAFTASPSWWCRRTRRPATGGVMRTSFQARPRWWRGRQAGLQRLQGDLGHLQALAQRRAFGHHDEVAFAAHGSRLRDGGGGVAAAAWVSAGPLQAAMATLISSPPTGQAAASKGWRWCRPWSRSWGRPCGWPWGRPGRSEARKRVILRSPRHGPAQTSRPFRRSQVSARVRADQEMEEGKDGKGRAAAPGRIGIGIRIGVHGVLLCVWVAQSRAGREPCLLQCNMCPELSKAKVPAASLCWEGWPVHWWMRDIPSYRRWPAQGPSARPSPARKAKAASAERAACGRWPAGKLSPLSGRWLSPVRQSARARWRGGR